MNKQSVEGSVLGAILLIGGCCIGAGMLGLPVLSAQGGMGPSTLLFLLSWLYMVATGLLLLEVNLCFQENVNLITMVKETLGNGGASLCWLLFIFLFYSLNVAYISASGTLFSSFTEAWTGKTLEPWVGSLLFTVIFAVLVFLGTRAVDEFNRVLMLGLILSYALLIVMGTPHVDFTLWKHVHWKASLLAIPAMIVSFGYHNLIPSLKIYLKGNITKLRWTIFLGSALPLVIYILWEGLILGIVPYDNFRQSIDSGEMATQALKGVVGSAWVSSAAHYFAFFAIVTSCIAVALSLVDFLADGFRIKKTQAKRMLLVILTLVPPFFLSFTYPGLFLTALGYAGAFGAVILFGILPALMVWKGRYGSNRVRLKHHEVPEMVPGGKPMLLFIIAISVAVVILEICIETQLLEI